MQTNVINYNFGVCKDANSGFNSVNNDGYAGLYGEWDPGRPSLINLENTGIHFSTPTANAYANVTPMHLYDLSWAPVLTNRGNVGNEAVDHVGAVENESHVFVWEQTRKNFLSGMSAGALKIHFGLHKSTQDDYKYQIDSTYDETRAGDVLLEPSLQSRPMQHVRWYENQSSDGPPTYNRTFNEKVYARDMYIRYNVTGTKSSPCRVDIRVIKLRFPFMHPLYASESGVARTAEEQSFYQAEWDRMVRSGCINPIARGDLPQPIPQKNVKWFKTISKKVIHFPEASADRGTLPMVSGSIKVNINRLMRHDWKVVGRGDTDLFNPGVDNDNNIWGSYDGVPRQNANDYCSFTKSQKPWFTSRYMLLVRATNSHQFKITKSYSLDPNIPFGSVVPQELQTDDLEDGIGGETGNHADNDHTRIDRDLNDDGNFNQLDYNHYLANYCPSYDLNIRKSFVMLKA